MSFCLSHQWPAFSSCTYVCIHINTSDAHPCITAGKRNVLSSTTSVRHFLDNTSSTKRKPVPVHHIDYVSFSYIFLIYTYTQRIPLDTQWHYLTTMPASLMTLPFELREQILIPIVRTRATIELQYPLWADSDKSVFASPIAQVCRELREEVFQCFYRANVFVWKIDSEPVRDSREWVARVRW